MKQKTIVVIGGGYAGLHTVDSLRKELRNSAGDNTRLILLDRNPYHFRKVLLVRAPIHSDNLYVPFESYGWEDVELLQGELKEISQEQNVIYYTTEDQEQKSLHYDKLILAVGSVMKQVEKNGLVLEKGSGIEQIQQQLHDLISKVEQTSNVTEREQIMQATIVGGGITGVETAAEMAGYFRSKSISLGLNAHVQRVRLIHSGDRLIEEADNYVGDRLEKKLHKLGVEVIKNIKAIQHDNDTVKLSNGEVLTGLCIWTLGTIPNPIVKKLGLPYHDDGRLLVDQSYRIQGVQNIYAIGDCARITDSKTGKVDGMNCKEAMMQAKGLGKVLKADLAKLPAPSHWNIVKDGYCVSLGTDDGFLWFKRLGINFVITGKMARRAKAYTWKIASILK